MWQPDDVREAVARGARRGDRRCPAWSSSTSSRRASSYSFEAQRPAVAARGLAEAERDLGSFVRAGNRVVVTFAHRGEALRTKALLRRVEAELLEPGDDAARDERAPASRSRRRAAGSSRASSGSCSSPTRRSSASARRATDARVGRALQSFADLRTGDYVVHEDHGVGRLLGFETKTVAGVTRDYLFLEFKGDDRLYVPHEQIGKVSRYVGADGAGAGALEARRQGVAARQVPRARRVRGSWPAS